MPGREAMRAGVVFWPSTSLPTGRLLQKATRCYFSSILSGALSWRARIPMQVRSNWNANHKYKRMFTGNAWNCSFRLNTYICRQVGETRSTKLSDRRAILPARHYVTYSLTHAPRKVLHGKQDNKTVIHILVQDLMAYSKGACEWPVQSLYWTELCKKAGAVSRRHVFPHNFNHVNKFGMWIYIIRPHLPTILFAHSKQVHNFATNLTFYRLRLSLLPKENQTCFGHMGCSRH